MRARLSFGIVLLVLAQARAQAAEAPRLAPETRRVGYTYQAQLGYRTGDGTFRPLFPDVVLMGWGEDGCQEPHQSPERLTFYLDGNFQLSISPVMATATHFEVDPSGAFTNPSPQGITIEWPCYRFRAKGCDDGVVQFGAKPPDTRIELNCPGRESAPRLDG